MTDRTWLGGGNNNARNPNDWSPTGAPQPGDILSMPNGGRCCVNWAKNSVRRMSWLAVASFAKSMRTKLIYQ